MNVLDRDQVAWSRRHFLVGASVAAAGAALWSSTMPAGAAPAALAAPGQTPGTDTAATAATADGLVAVADGFASGVVDGGSLRLRRSPDGATWTDTGGAVGVPAGARLLAMWAQGAELCALVGRGDAVSLFTAADGQRWQPAALPADQFVTASPTTALGIGPTALVLGLATNGGDGADGRPGVVAWIRSAAGDWRRIDGAPLGMHGSVVDVVADGDGTVTALMSDSVEVALVRSRDFVTWEPVALPGSVGHAAATMVRDRQTGTVYVTGARVDDPTTSSVWSWPAGAAAPGPMGSTRMHLSTHSVSGGTHVAIGEDASFRRAVWTSSDGLSWAPATVA